MKKKIPPRDALKQMKEDHDKKIRQDVEKALDDLTIRHDKLENEVQRCILNTREVIRREPNNVSEKNAKLMALRVYLGQYWFVKRMMENLQMAQAQMQMMEVTNEFGVAMESMVELTRGLGKESINFDALTEKYAKALKPFNNHVSGSLEDMAKSMMESSQMSSNTSQYSDSMLESIVNGTTSWQSIPTPYAAHTASVPQPQGQNMEQRAALQNDMTADDAIRSELASIMSALQNVK